MSHAIDGRMIARGLAGLFGILAAAAIVIWRGVAGSRSQLLAPSVYRGSSRRRAIALTFDDGPSPGTFVLLRLLEQEKVRATFFVCGQNVERHRDIANAIVLAGHELGNHTHTHARLCPRLGWKLNVLSPAMVIREVAKAQDAIERSTGVTPHLFRAPYGFRWFGLREAQRRFGLLGVMWTTIAHDWEWSAPRVAHHVLRRACPGGIVCLHDGRDTRPHPDISTTLEALREIIPALRRQGYAFETVSEMLGSDAGC